MTKTEWKKLYHDYRHGNFQWNVNMQMRNLPCGADDHAYEMRRYVVEAYIAESHPALKQVLDQIDSDDKLAYRAWLLEDLDHDYRLRRLKEMLSYDRDDRIAS